MLATVAQLKMMRYQRNKDTRNRPEVFSFIYEIHVVWMWSMGIIPNETVLEGSFHPIHLCLEEGINEENRYLDTYLSEFLLSAEQHFMPGLPVTYYVFTDSPDRVPKVPLGPSRAVETVHVQRHRRWQDISMMRMRSIADAIDRVIRHRHQYIFCLDVDQIFVARFGSEALGDSVALLHAFYYHRPKAFYTYDRNPKSSAYMEMGDFYYHAAVFGGSWQSVKNMTEWCYWGIMKDKDNQVEALWQDESHLNKYLWLHKPSKVLSPEYCWARGVGYRSDIRVTRLVWADKHYSTLRNPT